MKLKPDISITAFIQAVQTCQGEVYFVTPEGDRLNLKSALMEFVFVTAVSGKLQDLNGQVEMQNPKDIIQLCDYFIQDGM